jgi:ubiquinone/menaquinone biosynthesis C-methylase UbiE
MRNSIENNLKTWNEVHSWPEDGDEWNLQARLCNQPYDLWKQGLIDAFIEPLVPPGARVVEIAPGHGRWTEHLRRRAGTLHIVDLSPACIEHCRERFAAADNIEYHINDGRSLSFAADASVDLVWSFDAFVHMEARVIDAYVAEIARILASGGRAMIHHAGRIHSRLWLGFLLRFGQRGRRLYQRLSMTETSVPDGWKSNVSKELVAAIVTRRGLELTEQVQTWGHLGQYRIVDAWVTLIRKP